MIEVLTITNVCPNDRVKMPIHPDLPPPPGAASYLVF